MAWSELKGTRRIVDRQPHYIDYIITFQGVAASDTIPEPGDTYSDIVGSGSLPSTNLVSEPQAEEVSQIYRATNLKTRVTVRFRGEYSGA